MTEDELEFLNDLATDVMALVEEYAADPRLAALSEKVAARIRELEEAEPDTGGEG